MTLFCSAVASAGARIFYAYGNKISLPLPLPLASLPKPEFATDFRKRHFALGAHALVHTDTKNLKRGGCYLSWLGLQRPPLNE